MLDAVQRRITTKQKLSFILSPQPGDQIFFYSSDGNGFGHTGIVERMTSSKVYTVEGNTSAGAKVIPNGGAVCRKSYDLNNSRIGGYGRPNWALVDDSSIDDTPDEKKEGEGMIDVVECIYLVHLLADRRCNYVRVIRAKWVKKRDSRKAIP